MNIDSDEIFARTWARVAEKGVVPSSRCAVHLKWNISQAEPAIHYPSEDVTAARWRRFTGWVGGLVEPGPRRAPSPPER